MLHLLPKLKTFNKQLLQTETQFNENSVSLQICVNNHELNDKSFDLRNAFNLCRISAIDNPLNDDIVGHREDRHWMQWSMRAAMKTMD